VFVARLRRRRKNDRLRHQVNGRHVYSIVKDFAGLAVARFGTAQSLSYAWSIHDEMTAPVLEMA
jgi:hypothetical protein